MLQLPSRFATVILSFAPLFFQRSWRHAEVLLLGAILAPGTRTVTRLLRITGLAQERHFVNYHRVLNRAVWSPRAVAGRLPRLLIAAFVPRGPVVLGLDDTIERRRGTCIAAKGIYRDPVRSSHGHCVKASGLRWLSLMLLAPIPWAGRVWALPFLTALAPSERYNQAHGRPHKKLTDWGRQLVLQARRWLPGRTLVRVTDSSFAAIGFLAALCRHNVTCITRLRLDAALYAPAPPRQPGAKGRPRKSGARLANLSAVLLDSTTMALGKAGLPAVKINPFQARRFAQASGKRVKTDPLDAAMLARFGVSMPPDIPSARDETVDSLAELLAARRALVKHRTAALNRGKVLTLTLLKRQSQQHLKQIETQIEAIDHERAAILATNEKLKTRYDILVSMPALGAATALALLIDRPELGFMDAKQTASLAGRAPVTQQSGKWIGKSYIQGGRANLRQALYMPALVAIRFNPQLKAKYLALRQAGKPANVAIVAIMRKIIITANALPRDNRMWTPEVA